MEECMASIAWSISAGDATGAGVTANGSIAADAVTTAATTLDAGTNKALALQIDDVTKVAMFTVTCTRYDGSISLKGGDAADPTLALTGPLVAFGAAAHRLVASLGTVTITAASNPTTAATVSFFIATRLT
jgi:hypothetical protein